MYVHILVDGEKQIQWRTSQQEVAYILKTTVYEPVSRAFVIVKCRPEKRSTNRLKPVGVELIPYGSPEVS